MYVYVLLYVWFTVYVAGCRGRVHIHHGVQSRHGGFENGVQDEHHLGVALRARISEHYSSRGGIQVEYLLQSIHIHNITCIAYTYIHKYKVLSTELSSGLHILDMS